MSKSTCFSRWSFKNKGIGEKFLSGLKKESAVKGFDYELCLKPKPIVLDGKKNEIFTAEKGELIASINSKSIITEGSTKVIVIPYV